MTTRPVVPIDPQGNMTDRVGRGYPGPGPTTEAEPWFETTAELHIQPWSDTMNHPATVADMLKPSTSATMMVGPWWRTDRNVLGDADGLPTPFGSRYDGNLDVSNAALYSGNFQRLPNTSSGVPADVKMSGIMQKFNSYLQAVQHRLLGSP